MHQQLSVNQITRKKILTRSDLLTELESILKELAQGTQFAGLRSCSLDSFLATDNPALRCMTLGDLATNPIEALRDQMAVEKQEIAALVEALYLLNVKSDYSLTLLRDTFSKIEESADNVQQILQEVVAGLPSMNLTSRVAPADANVAKLRTALGELRKSVSFSKIENQTIEQFWDKRASSCSVLSNMTWKQMIETPPSKVFDLPNFGKSRFKHLLGSIERARSGLKNESISSGQPLVAQCYSTIEQAQNSILEGISEIKSKSCSMTGNFADVLIRANSQALLTAFLSRTTIQRRVGQILGVTESRISQLLQQAHKDVVNCFTELDSPTMMRLEKRLSSPACSEACLSLELGLSGLNTNALQLLRIVAASLGAVNLNFKGRDLETHWTKSSQNIEDIISKLSASLPLSTIAFAKLVDEAMPNCAAQQILAVLPPNLFFLKSSDFWYQDQEQALYEVLKQAKSPLSAQEITGIFETGPRQMRYLLQNSKNISRIGRNNGRRYTISA